ncbi:MAG: cytochrome c [Anaerolineae bacterium]|nr:cytochrome c [Anaerolineae bacterium]
MNIQNKVLLGIGSFVGIMLLVGWVAINEPARMEVFTEQWHGRSVERGAALFLSSCATCHNADGKGQEGRAPALQNPMLFLTENPAKVAKAKVADLQTQLKTLTDSQTAYDDAVKNLPDLEAKRDQLASNPDSQEYKDAVSAVETAQAAVRNYDPNTPQKVTDMNTQITTAQSDLDALVAQGWEPDRDVRLVEMGWGGTLADYIEGTLISGRPASKFYWPQAMPNWAQSTGGPLRPDEIQNLVDFILNWQADAVKLTPNDLNQQFKLPVSGPPKQTIAQEFGANPDVTTLDLSGGDAANGQSLYASNACQACHAVEGGAAYPFAPTPGTWTRVIDVRLKDPANAGLTPEQYLAHSILDPNAYIVPGASAGLMPQTFASSLSIQELRDIIAYLATQQ